MDILQKHLHQIVYYPLFFFRILSIKHKYRKRVEGLIEIDSGIYPTWPNFWIYSTDFKLLQLTLIFQCRVNPLFYLFIYLF